MRAAPISLTNYFVSELQFQSNRTFDPKNPFEIKIEDIDVKKDAKPSTEDRRKWEVTLEVKLIERPERNLPCNLALEMLGLVEVDQSVKDENIERFVQINGVSLVFSAAREIVRAITSRGPNGSILLPTVTFWQPKSEAPPVIEKTEIPSGDNPKETAPAAAT
jgi:preprotein translocase subunit SecB